MNNKNAIKNKVTPSMIKHTTRIIFTIKNNSPINDSLNPFLPVDKVISENFPFPDIPHQ